MKPISILAAALATSAIAAPAQAILLDFTISGAYSAKFQIDSNPIIHPFDFGLGLGFDILDVPGFPDALFGVADVTFYNSALDGGIQIYDFFGGVDFLITDGPQLYTGPESAPMFRTGTFALTDYFTPSISYTLTIVEAPIPEPASWAMMIGGFALAGAAMRRKSRLSSISYAGA